MTEENANWAWRQKTVNWSLEKESYRDGNNGLIISAQVIQREGRETPLSRFEIRSFQLDCLRMKEISFCRFVLNICIDLALPCTHADAILLLSQQQQQRRRRRRRILRCSVVSVRARANIGRVLAHILMVLVMHCLCTSLFEHTHARSSLLLLRRRRRISISTTTTTTMSTTKNRKKEK